MGHASQRWRAVLGCTFFIGRSQTARAKSSTVPGTAFSEVAPFARLIYSQSMPDDPQEPAMLGTPPSQRPAVPADPADHAEDFAHRSRGHGVSHRLARSGRGECPGNRSAYRGQIQGVTEGDQAR